MVMKRKDRTFRGVVEHCFSGMKLKVRLEQEGRLIAINLLGVRNLAQDKNQPTLLGYANDAFRMAKSCLFNVRSLWSSFLLINAEHSLAMCKCQTNPTSQLNYARKVLPRLTSKVTTITSVLHFLIKC